MYGSIAMSEIDSLSFLLDYVNIHCWSITVYFYYYYYLLFHSKVPICMLVTAATSIK